MWGVGCILAELLVGHPLFSGPTVEAVLGAQSAVLGPPPERMLQASRTSCMYFMPGGSLYSLDPPGHPAGTACYVRPLETPLDTLTGPTDPGLRDLLHSLLRVDPAERISAASALAHPWLSQFVGASAGAPSDRVSAAEGTRVPEDFRRSHDGEPGRQHERQPSGEWRKRLVRMISKGQKEGDITSAPAGSEAS